MRRTFKRRRKEGKTDYYARLALLKSGKNRIIVRKTNRYIIAQLVSSERSQDKVIVNISSKDLIAKGWPKEMVGSLKSMPASYLTGMLIGRLSLKHCKEAILDIGLNRNIQKSRIYAVLKGIVDSGLKIPFSEEVLPSLEEIRKHKDGKNIDKIKEKI